MVLPLLLAAAFTQPVWIDTDPSVARGGHEIDDGFALIQAFRSPELAVRGISIVYGNAPLAQADPIGRALVKRYGPPDFPVHIGAASAADLGRDNDATRALTAALRKERLTILALGPATNVASVLKLHPELARRITRIIAVAGRRKGQQFRVGDSQGPLRDFNFELDAPAFQAILDARVPLTLAPWEISSKVWLTKADLDPIRASIDPLYEPALDWLAKWKHDFHVDGFNPFDTLAVGYLTARSAYRCEVLPITIETSDKPYLVVDSGLNTKHKAEYCSDAGPEFKKQLLSRLARQ